MPLPAEAKAVIAAGASTTLPVDVDLTELLAGRQWYGDSIVDMNVRRLAAIDMHGIYGTRFRRRLILAEFVIGAVVLVPVGAWQALSAAGIGGRSFGLWLTGIGLNYLPLSAYAIGMTRAGALAEELAGVDVAAELRRYTVLQLWVLVPLSLVVFSARQILARGRSRR